MFRVWRIQSRLSRSRPRDLRRLPSPVLGIGISVGARVGDRLIRLDRLSPSAAEAADFEGAFERAHGASAAGSAPWWRDLPRRDPWTPCRGPGGSLCARLCSPTFLSPDYSVVLAFS